MLKNTTMNLPDELVARVRAYAAQNQTTMTAIVREHFEAITEPERIFQMKTRFWLTRKGCSQGARPCAVSV